MTVKQGTYRIYANEYNEGEPAQVLIGRVMVHKGNFYTLEDHMGLIAGSVPDGKMDKVHEKFLSSIEMSPYLKLISEQNVNQGNHDDLIDEVKWDETNPEARYVLIGDDEPKRVEMYGNIIVVDGQRLSDEEAKVLVEEIRENKYRMMPV